MRVALGTTLLEQGLSGVGVDGIGNYSRALMAELNRLPQLDIQPYVFSGARLEKSTNHALQAGNFGVRSLYSLATGRPFPDRFSAFAGRFDLVHATDHLVPCLRNIPVVATLMDAVPLSHPEWVSYPMKGLKNALWKRSAHWATHVVTISEHSKQELIKWFGLPEQNISITPLGVDQRWFEVPAPEDLQRVRRHYQLPQRFFLFVGTLQPRKNVARLIAAHQMLGPSLRKECPLVVAGRAGWGCEQELQALKSGDDGTLRWINHIPDADLLPVVSQASALTFPSLYEGFGLPVLEAFAAGVPVITSNTTALPEVAGQAAFLVDPIRVTEIADAMSQLSADEALAMELGRRGKERAGMFTWDRTAKLTAEIYARVLATF